MSKQIQREVETALRESIKGFIGGPVDDNAIDRVRQTLIAQLNQLVKDRKLRIVPRFELRHPTAFSEKENRWVQDKRHLEVVWNEDDLIKAGVRE